MASWLQWKELHLVFHLRVTCMISSRKKDGRTHRITTSRDLISGTMHPVIFPITWNLWDIPKKKNGTPIRLNKPPGLFFAKELDVSSILKQCRICGTLGFFQRQLKLIRFTSSKSHAFPKKHSRFRIPSCEIFYPYFMGYLDLFLGMFVGMSVLGACES